MQIKEKRKRIKSAYDKLPEKDQEIISKQAKRISRSISVSHPNIHVSYDSAIEILAMLGIWINKKENEYG